MIERALISVSEKQGLDCLIHGLFIINPYIEIISFGDTEKAIREIVGTEKHFEENHWIQGDKYKQDQIINVYDFTDLGEMLMGRVKTLHPQIHGGISYLKNIDAEEAKINGIVPIDLVVCNFSLLTQTSVNHDTLEEFIENFDIGGPAMIMGSVMNYKKVIVVVDHKDYSMIIDELKLGYGELNSKSKEMLAIKAVKYVADYWSLNTEK
ncbi:hypothetical protein J4418_04910 [Candidatus Woesearchaeota archaeon]|nr:hypothetical protein [Candidatus Woesearchaeota archaeon]